MISLDTTDQAILEVLKDDSRLSLRQVARKVFLSAPAVAERVRRLEDRGIIKGYTINIDRSQLEQKISAFVSVSLAEDPCLHTRFVDFARTREEIIEFYHTAGDSCYLVKIVVDSHAALHRFTQDVLAYGNYRMSVVLGESMDA